MMRKSLMALLGGALLLLAPVLSLAQAVTAPTGQVPLTALAFGTKGTAAIPVDASHPVPMMAYDGGINTLGTRSDSVCASDAGNCSLVALDKLTNTRLSSLLTATGSPFQAGGSIGNTAFGISGTLPAFASTPTFNCGTGCYLATQPVSGTFWQATQPISAASLPLPSGAATAAKQPALGTAASPSTDVITVQGAVASAAANAGYPVKVGCVYKTSPSSNTTGNIIDALCDPYGNQAVLNKYAGASTFDNLGISNNITGLSFASGTSDGVPHPLAIYGYLQDSASTQYAQRGILYAATAADGHGVTAVENAGAAFANITTATTTTVKSGAGILHAICTNTLAASATITIYNNTAGSGTKIGTITNPGTLVQQGPLCATYDLAFSTGLTLVTTGTQDITVTYR